MPGVRATFRLAKVALVSLIEMHARLERTVTRNAALAATVEWRRHHVVVRGQTHAQRATIAFEDRAGVPVTSDFNLSLPRPDRGSGLLLQTEADTVHFAAPRRAQIGSALLFAVPKACFSVARYAADITTFLRTGDAATAARLRKAFGLTPETDSGCVLPHDLLGHPPPRNLVQSDVTVLVPVYNAANDLAALLDRLRSATVPIILVNDGSSDPSIAPMLDQFAQDQQYASIITHAKNRGFVAAVNSGLEQARGHVILLNTDTLPPQGFIERLVAPIQDDPSIATVTPFSNHAEILSVPHACIHTEICGAAVDKIDQAAQRISKQYQTVELPTGIGFCMAMNRRYLDQVPLFDPAFGRGYGEEVDWCRKTLALGGRHVALSSLFVGHRGSASFGAERADRLKTSTAIIRRRYPGYEAHVQSWIRTAPAQAQILALSVAWLAAAADERVLIYLAHSMGGGAETALADSIQTHLENGAPGVIVLRVGGPARWRLELVTREVTHIGDTMDGDIVEAVLAPIARRHLIYSCGVGGRHPTDAPQMLRRLATRNTTLEVHLHDFFPISPSWNLLGSSGDFVGVPQADTADAAHSVPALDGCAPVPHSAWRGLWSGVFARAESVIAFSKTSRDLISEAYPEVREKTEVRPHVLRALPDAMAPGGCTIGILGSLNLPKGAEIAQNLARFAGLQRRIVVLGEMDGQFSFPKPHLVHGPFAHDQISALARSYGIGLWLIPSICPETFSFATHEALATGLPVLAFDRGAQGEAVNAAANGHLITVDPGETAQIAEQIEALFANPRL